MKSKTNTKKMEYTDLLQNIALMYSPLEIITEESEAKYFFDELLLVIYTTGNLKGTWLLFGDKGDWILDSGSDAEVMEGHLQDWD